MCETLLTARSRFSESNPREPSRAETGSVGLSGIDREPCAVCRERRVKVAWSRECGFYANVRVCLNGFWPPHPSPNLDERHTIPHKCHPPSPVAVVTLTSPDSIASFDQHRKSDPIRARTRTGSLEATCPCYRGRVRSINVVGWSVPPIFRFFTFHCTRKDAPWSAERLSARCELRTCTHQRTFRTSPQDIQSP